MIGSRGASGDAHEPDRGDRPARRLSAAALAALTLPLSLAACSSSGDDSGSGTSVMDVKVGQCFLAPEEVKAQIADIDRVDCGQPHAQEAYAKPTYDGDDSFPGDDVLDKFAEGACAEQFGTYVGVDYLDSSLFFTYLAPSARSWQDEDRTVLCFVSSAGKPLVGSVKGSAL